MPGRSAKYGLFLLLLWFSTALWAERFTFREYGPSEGLTSLDVNCLLQDRAGFLWVGTDNGLFRYNGDRFEGFNRSDGLPNVEVTSLAESPSGMLWVGTQGGLAVRIGRSFQTLPAIGSTPVAGIGFDQEARLYANTPGGLLQGTALPDGSYGFTQLAPGDVTAFRLDGEDVLFSQGGDLWRSRRGAKERIGSPLRLPLAQWEDFVRDTKGRLWVRSSGKLFMQDHNGASFVDRSEGIPPATRGRLSPDPQGGMVVATNEGAVILNGEQRWFLDANHGFPDIAVTPVLFTSDQSMWLGTRGTGILRRLGHGEWLSWKRGDGLLNNTVWSVLSDIGGRLWVGTDGGLSIFDSQGGPLQSTWNTHSQLGSDEILAIAQDPRSKDVFVGGNPGALGRFDRQGHLRETFDTSAGITREHVMALVVDAQNFLWIGSHDGCFRSHRPLYMSGALSFDRVAIPGLPVNLAVRALAADERGQVWLGTANGLARFDGQHWSVLTTRDGLKSDSINALAEHEGVVWLAYRADMGVTRLDMSHKAPQLTTFTAADGLSSNVIFAIALDRAGHPWITTDQGLNYQVAGHWRHQGAADGLIWEDTDDRALSLDESGKVWVGTSQGLSVFDPSFPIPAAPAATTILSSARSGSQAWRTGSNPVLRYANSALTLRFSSLSFAAQASERFRYRLKGFENSWIETSERSVQYAGLPAGSYVFEVESSRPDGSWDDTPARFAFSITPPLWRTWWFLTLVSLALILAVATFWRYRVRSLLTRQHLLEKEVLDRTEELRISHERLHEIAYRDPLTLLPNRRLFTDQFRNMLLQAAQERSRFALLLLDLDRFKQVNDEFGHDVGDAVLVEAGVRIRSVVECDTLVARLGGDEFAVLLRDVSSHSAVDVVAHCINTALSQTMQLESTTLTIGCSTGWAIYPEDALTQEALYKAADVALYRTKRKNRAVAYNAAGGDERRAASSTTAFSAVSQQFLA